MSFRAVTTAVLSLAFALLLAATAVRAEAAAPRWEVLVHHGPTSFQPGGAGELGVFVNNIGDADARADADGDGVPESPMSFTVELPPELETRTQNTLHYNGVSTWMGDVNWADPGWTCSSSTPGESALTCTLNREPMSPGGRTFDPWGARVMVYVAVAPGVSGSLPVRVTMSGGGADPVSVLHQVPVGSNPDTFGVDPDTFEADAFDEDAQPERRAGAHPFRAITAFAFNSRSEVRDSLTSGLEVGPQPVSLPVGTARDLELRLPRGFVGDPTAVAQCSRQDFARGYRAPECPADSQVGIAQLMFQSLFLGPVMPTGTYYSPVYSLTPSKGRLASFGFVADARLIVFHAELDPVDQSVLIKVPDIIDTTRVHYQRMTLWGVPASSAYDVDRYDTALDQFGVATRRPVEPFLTLPTECGVPDTTDLRAASWQDPANWTPWISSAPTQVHGCELLSFAPSAAIAADTSAPDAPTGLKVDLGFPQDEQPDGFGTPPLRNARVTLPEGMTINPASAGGLAACSDAQLGLGTDAPVSCPDGARIGTVTAHTPVLTETIEGSVYLRSQNSSDPGSGEMFRLALVLENEERGLRVKLPGSVKVDEATGRIVTEFDNNPQLPVSRISLRLKSGPRAPLATPASCGEKTIQTRLESWGGQVSNFTDTISVDCAPGLGGFSPTFAAGTSKPLAGAFSPFVAGIVKPDGQAPLTGLRMELPTGLLATLKGNLGSQVGTVTAFAGPGSQPFALPGRVYLEGPYGDAPYSLRVVVPAKAGPFDLGEVVVRQKIYVDPTDAHVTVVSDPIPTIVKGVPVRLQRLDVNVDKPGFIVNPTSCAPKVITGTLSAADGQSVPVTSRFKVGECQTLPVKPKLKLGLTGRKQLTDGKHPGLKATLTQRAGQAGLKKVAVKLPLSLALDPDNADGLCEHVESIKPEPNCPKSSIVGRAKAWTPLLDKPLEGPVYFAKNVRRDPKSGRQIRTLPKLVIPLRGEVSLNLIGNSDTTKDGRLVNTFATVPDAPVSRFELSLAGGKKGILVVNGKACKRSRVAGVEIDGHNGKTANQKPKLAAPCGKQATKRKRR